MQVSLSPWRGGGVERWGWVGVEEDSGGEGRCGAGGQTGGMVEKGCRDGKGGDKTCGVVDRLILSLSTVRLAVNSVCVSVCMCRGLFRRTLS